MILQGAQQYCFNSLFFLLMLAHFVYLAPFVALWSEELAPVPRALSASTFVWTYLSDVCLWQYWLRPDWSFWGILLMAAINLGFLVAGYLSATLQSPESEYIAKIVVLTAGITIIFQMIFAIWIFILQSRSYEPFVKNTAVSRWRNWRSLQIPAQDAACDKPLSHFSSMLPLESVYQMHEHFRKEEAGNLSRIFAPVRHLTGQRKSRHCKELIAQAAHEDDWRLAI